MSERSQTHATFVLERYYPVPVERVWDTFADLEMKRQWFGSSDFVERERRERLPRGSVDFDCIDRLPTEARPVHNSGGHRHEGGDALIHQGS